MHNFTVTSEDSRKRLDQFLLAKLPSLSRTYIQKVISQGHVQVDKEQIMKKNLSLKEGQKIKMVIPESTDLSLEAEDIPLDIIYEDDNFLVVNKPPNMIVHPAPNQQSQTGTLVHALLHHCKDSLSGIGGVKRPGIVHRLDKNTSGLIICAKNDPTHRHFSNIFQNRAIKKTYLALIKGHLPSPEGTIDAPIHRHKVHRKKMTVMASGRPAVSHYKVVEEYEKCSLVEVRIETGRTHQIRVHFSSINHPIIGDDTYGEDGTNKRFKQQYGLKRSFLHAHKLTFAMPNTKKERTFTSPLPSDLKKVIKQLK